MQIDIRSRGFALTHALREYVERRLRFALVHAGDRVRRVAVRLTDVNGPRGGNDKRCRIQVTLNGFPTVVIEDTEAQSLPRHRSRRRPHRAQHHAPPGAPQRAPDEEPAGDATLAAS